MSVLFKKIGKPHKIEAETYLGPEAQYYCKACGKAVTIKPGSMNYRHLDYTPPRNR